MIDPNLTAPDFHGLVATSPTMRKVFEQIRRASRSNVTVLIRGESGTGKELVARALHADGPRGVHPFRAVNCATFTSDLLASEIFGHVKGAFTGAVRDKDGLMAQANHGTLFLDEVAEIPLSLQGRLLRVLQERRFTPVGGTRELKADVRIISATNSGLRELVAARKFREDLMYRLRVVVLRLPPLRDRGDDLRLLTWTLIHRFNSTSHRTITQISPAAWRAMSSYPWPGNIRELQNNLEAAFVIGDGPTLTLDDLAPELRGEGPEPYRAPQAANVPTLLDLERQRLVKAFEDTGGRRDAMAALLEISRSTLYRKLKQHGLA